MKILKLTFSASQIKAVLRKDFLVRWRQPWMSVVQVLWPCMVFMLLYLIRLKFGPEHIEDCQFPTRLLPTKNNVLPGFYSYICTIENKCMSTKEYEEYSKFENAPMRPIIDIVQIFINDDSLFNAVVDLPVKANFISAVTTVVTGGHLDDIRKNVEKVIDMVPEIEKQLNGSFDIKAMFSDRKTFVKSGYLLCGHPFPSTESIPLVNDIFYSEDFSEINDDELEAMPTKYCKKLYLDVTSTNHGKLTWEAIKPIITGKILYTPDNRDTRSIMQFTNSTFEEINRLRMLSVAMEQILTKLRVDESFQRSFDSLLKLAQSPFVRSLLGDEIDIDQIQAVIHRIRTDPVIYDVINTIKNILECFSVDRFVGVESPTELRKAAYELNQKRLFYAAVAFNKTTGSEVVYHFHMDTENTQPTIENHNRFWFPGPSRSMVRDMKYHRGFVQIKQSLDMGIIKHKKKELRATGMFMVRTTTSTESNFNIQVINGDGEDEPLDGAADDDEDDWFTNGDDKELVVKRTNATDSGGLLQSSVSFPSEARNAQVALDEAIEETTTTEGNTEDSTEAIETPIASEVDVEPKTLDRQKRQGIFDFFSSLAAETKKDTYEVDKLQYFTKQFPYPSYIHDDFKTGLYLAQAVQVAFFLGLVAQIASCVRHLIWMRESRNSMLMRSMGMKPCSEIFSWVIVTFIELLIIFGVVTVILYTGGILMYTRWLFVMIFLIVFGACLMSFCFMCSTFFSSASIGSVAAGVFFFITFCPYILVLLFDAKLNSLQNFGINLSFTTAFSYAWSHVMRMELQQTGLTFAHVFEEGLRGDYGFGVFMIVFDTILYAVIASISQRYKNDENRFVAVHREDLDASVGATLTNVSKVYDDNKVAVSNINLSFPKNKVTCLLGRNGAGKSTIIKMLTGQVVQTTGRVVLSQAMTVRQDYDKIGVCSQDNILIPNLTAREHLEMYAKIKMKHNYNSEVDKTLKNLNFGKHEGYEVCQLSGGFQRRLCVAIAFIGSPNVVILDEPCNGVDSKARRDIWELIERLRKGRAVVFTTHFLDEAENLSDSIVIMKNGKIIAQHNPESLKLYGSVKYEISMQCANTQTANEIIAKGKQLFVNLEVLGKRQATDLRLEIPYDQAGHESSDYLKCLQQFQHDGLISDLTIETQNLEQLFRQLDQQHNTDDTSISALATNANGHAGVDMFKAVPLKHDAHSSAVRDAHLTRFEAIRELFWKRVKHFGRNYRMLLCVLVLPAIFELLAMWFVAYRLEDDFDKVLHFSRSELYPKSTQMLSMEQSVEFTRDVYAGLQAECTTGEFACREFKHSKNAFYWILESLNEYQGKRYGGYSFNDTKSTVWYNNKGYHAMMAWLNDLNTHLFQTEMNSTEYSISAYNEPWKLGFSELSTSSILRQAGDSCMIFILLIAYSLVVAVASVYLVNERMKGEKLQQRLCGVDAATYWGVAFVWDFLIIIMAILVCTTIIIAFNMPVFVARQQLMGIVVLALFYGFACIPAVHVFEKFFSDASVAIVTIFCMNVIIPLFTMAIIVLLGVIGDSPTWDEWRYFLNRLFLIFPQHALGDGLLEIVKNYMVALTFRRYDIDSYKNPLNSDLLKPHLIALAVLGIFFAVLNVLLECGLLHRLKAKFYERCNWMHANERKHLEELKIVSIQNSLKRPDKYDSRQVLKVDNLSKSYGRSGSGYAVRNVTFAVKAGECFGLLGKNGAGKSTIFKMLSGEEYPSLGDIHYFDKEISYCPQTNTLDSLLTVQECIEFYGRLRRITDIPKHVAYVLEVYQLEAYRNVLVKNLSGGNRRKLTVATTCCGRTSTVLMDEPTSDMDPMTRALVYRTIHSLLAEQRGIVLTSHSISEIDEICDRIAVLKDGQMLTCSSPESLKAQYGGFYNVAVFCDQDKSPNVDKLIRQRIPESVDVQIYSHSVKFSVKIDNQTHSTDTNHKAQRESGIDVPVSMQCAVGVPSSTITLAELFDKLHSLATETGYGEGLRYAVNRCRLDAVFERILDSSDNHIKSDALNGSASTGYTHNGYVETENETRA